ncbi:MAG: ParB/RepB/Spo0J family partition protein [Candidatus Acididesulfobacter guangdongensis]|uniref:ParB/RepB/Spo0J family partition protein n=1 Tax=Acididesulfobacter guangdongensis TaxID=2597225 RepID=A0A519BIR3_ACIG2|nr:MAG: ParB/RepB/Spo0J family partition protein [Candidatus Acididesulfobacter guangdongensis]
MFEHKQDKTLKIKRNVLGRGLGALLSDNGEGVETSDYKIFEIDINKIKTGIYQPRIYFDDKKLEELKNSIKENGIIQPLLITKSSANTEGGAGGEIYDLIAGERRYRAAKQLNFKTVPAIIKDLSGSKAIEVALIENIQRQDLNVIEEAQCYKRLIDEFNLTHEELSAKIGKDRATITNMLRLLALSPEIKENIINGVISPSHARNLIGLSETEALSLTDKIDKEKLTVREVEEYVKNLKTINDTAASAKNKTKNKNTGSSSDRKFSALQAQIKDYENKIFEKMQAQVKINYKINHQKNKVQGNIEIKFNSDSQLEKIIESLLA